MKFQRTWPQGIEVCSYVTHRLILMTDKSRSTVHSSDTVIGRAWWWVGIDIWDKGVAKLLCLAGAT